MPNNHLMVDVCGKTAYDKIYKIVNDNFKFDSVYVLMAINK